MGHIPASDTCFLPVLSFAEALEPTPGADYDRSAWLYVPDHYSEYRYILGTVGRRPLICLGVNPSTAAPGALDNTLKSTERIAHGNGFDSFLMLNVYAQRATRPEDMDRQLNLFLHQENLRAFEWVLRRGSEPPVVWAAWGAVIEKRSWLPGCVRDFLLCGQPYGARWVTAGRRSKAGHPHHPLYLRTDTRLDPFDDLEEYLTALSAGANRRK